MNGFVSNGRLLLLAFVGAENTQRGVRCWNERTSCIRKDDSTTQRITALKQAIGLLVRLCFATIGDMLDISFCGWFDDLSVLPSMRSRLIGVFLDKLELSFVEQQSMTIPRVRNKEIHKSEDFWGAPNLKFYWNFVHKVSTRKCQFFRTAFWKMSHFWYKYCVEFLQEFSTSFRKLVRVQN